MKRIIDKKSSIPYILIIVGFVQCLGSKPEVSEFSLEGKWKDIKGDSVYEKGRKEIIFDIQRIGEDYSGRLVSLDNALDSKGEMRKCSKCKEEPGSQMLLGLPLLRNLRKNADGKDFSGQMYDIQQRKWFDVNIKPLSRDKIQVRVFAKIPLFGKSFVWERGENYYKEWLSRSPDPIQKPKKGIYALSLGEIDQKNESEVIVRVEHTPPFQDDDMVYFYDFQGKKTAEGKVTDFSANQLRIKLIQIGSEFSHSPSIPVVFYTEF